MPFSIVTQGVRFTVHSSRLIALLFSSFLPCNKEFVPDLCAIARGVLQEPDGLCIWFRIEPVFHESNLEPLNVEPELQAIRIKGFGQAVPCHSQGNVKVQIADRENPPTPPFLKGGGGGF